VRGDVVVGFVSHIEICEAEVSIILEDGDPEPKAAEEMTLEALENIVVDLRSRRAS